MGGEEKGKEGWVRERDGREGEEGKGGEERTGGGEGRGKGVVPPPRQTLFPPGV